MSIEIWFTPKAASLHALKKFIQNEGFVRAKWFLNALPEGGLGYSWFSLEKYHSLDGVEAIIYPERNLGHPKKWKLHLRTRAGASAVDLQRQNEVVRRARQLFGGSFYNDHEGRNIYTKIHPSSFISIEQAGIAIAYDRVKRQIYQLKGAIDDYDPDPKLKVAPGTHPDIINLVNAQRPSLTLFNSLLPFLVSVFEHFLGEVFTVILELDPSAQRKATSLKLRDIRGLTTVQDILPIIAGNETMAEKIARSVNFQNFEQANKSFKDFIEFDLYQTLMVKRRSYKNTGRVYDHLIEIIDRRHRVIHRFEFELDVDKEKFIHFLHVINNVVDLITARIDKNKKFTILKRSFYHGLNL